MPEQTEPGLDTASDSAPGASAAFDAPPQPELAGTASTAEAAAPVVAPVRGGPGFLVLFAGGAAAAALGFGLAHYGVLQDLPSGPSQDRLTALETRIAAQEEAASGLASDVSAQLAALQADERPRVSPEEFNDIARDAANAAIDAQLAPVVAQLSELSQQGTEMSETLGVLQLELATLVDAMAMAMSREGEDPAVATALRARIEAAEAERGAAMARVEALRAETDALARAAQEQAEAAAAAARLEAEQAASRALAQGASLRLRAALDSGGAFTAALEELNAAGVEVPAELMAHAEGVASLPSLQSGFSAAARAALSEARRAQPAEESASVFERGRAFLESQTGARSLVPRDGDDPDAVLSRAEAQLRSGDLAGTISELATLPEVALSVPAMADWRSSAKTRLAVEATLDTLAQTLAAQ